MPPHVERNGLRIIPGMAMKEGGVANGIPPGRQVVTVVTPMFTMWVWAGLPEWPAHPDRVAEAYPSLHSRMFIPKDPLGPVRPGCHTSMLAGGLGQGHGRAYPLRRRHVVAARC